MVHPNRFHVVAATAAITMASLALAAPAGAGERGHRSPHQQYDRGVVVPVPPLPPLPGHVHLPSPELVLRELARLGPGWSHEATRGPYDRRHSARHAPPRPPGPEFARRGHHRDGRPPSHGRQERMRHDREGRPPVPGRHGHDRH